MTTSKDQLDNKLKEVHGLLKVANPYPDYARRISQGQTANNKSQPTIKKTR